VIGGVADGQYTVMSMGPDGEGIAQVALDAGRRSIDVDLRLDRGRPIAVQVRGHGPLGDIALFAFRLPLHDSVAAASTDGRGVGALDLTEGRYRLVARRVSGEDGRLEVGQAEIAVGAAPAARPFELVLR